jgi:hypothetical protein
MMKVTGCVVCLSRGGVAYKRKSEAADRPTPGEEVCPSLYIYFRRGPSVRLFLMVASGAPRNPSYGTWKGPPCYLPVCKPFPACPVFAILSFQGISAFLSHESRSRKAYFPGASTAGFGGVEKERQEDLYRRRVWGRGIGWTVFLLARHYRAMFG